MKVTSKSFHKNGDLKYERFICQPKTDKIVLKSRFDWPESLVEANKSVALPFDLNRWKKLTIST